MSSFWVKCGYSLLEEASLVTLLRRNKGGGFREARPLPHTLARNKEGIFHRRSLLTNNKGYSSKIRT